MLSRGLVETVRLRLKAQVMDLSTQATYTHPGRLCSWMLLANRTHDDDLFKV